MVGRTPWDEIPLIYKRKIVDEHVENHKQVELFVPEERDPIRDVQEICKRAAFGLVVKYILFDYFLMLILIIAVWIHNWCMFWFWYI